MKKLYLFSGILSLCALSLFVCTSVASAAEKCSFTRDLEIGSEGEDVRCLQKFLNSSDFIISTTGAGSVGKETGTFQEKTKQALIKWQISKAIYPATGNFGPLSKIAYDIGTMTVIVPPVVQTPSPTSVSTPAASTPAVSLVSSTERKTKDRLKELRDLIKKAENNIDDAGDDGEDIADATKLLERGRDKFLDAVYAYFDGDYNKVGELIDKAKKNVNDAAKNFNGDSEDADDAIQDAKKALSDARSEINDAEDDGDDIDDAMDLYEKARDKYNKARGEFDDENYSEAEDLAKEAEDLADEAVDAL